MSRFLHTMLRVGDLDRSVAFYTKAFGMKELRRRDVPDGKYTLAFVGYGDEDSNTAIELTYNYGVQKYEMGGAFGHLAVGGQEALQVSPAPGVDLPAIFLEQDLGITLDASQRRAPVVPNDIAKALELLEGRLAGA